MNNVHPIFREALAPFAPVVFKPMCAFTVTIGINGVRHDLNVMNRNASDATIQALKLFFDDDDEMPKRMAITVHPMEFRQ
jgi:hypothetical protein